MICKTIFKRSLFFAIATGLVLCGNLRNLAQVSTGSEFNINKVPIVKPKLGKFPYFSLIEGYEQGKGFFGENVNVPFDRYEFFDGTKIITVEGRLQTIIARGQGASPYEVLKTYERLVKELGGVAVFEGTGSQMYRRDIEFRDKRARRDASSDDKFGVYMIRTPNSEIWVEVYTIERMGYYSGYQLTVVEKQPLKIRATLLTAEEMKKELDSKSRVALDIEFEDGKSDIKGGSQPTVNEIAKLMKNNPKLNLTVKARSDNKGTREANRRLSEARAQSVVKALRARGIDQRRLKAAGDGQDTAVGESGVASGEAKSRSVELVKSN